jgi:hypothetical protein
MKKLLISMSIITVVLLILGSLTNVVGYQSVKSNALLNSPLFNIRTQMATNQSQKNVTTYFLGKGREILLQFPIREPWDYLVEGTLEYISKMDVPTFDSFINRVLDQVQNKEKNQDIHIEQMIKELWKLKDNSGGFGNYGEGMIENLTWRYSPTLCWFPGCTLLVTIDLFFFILLIIFLFGGSVIMSSLGERTMFCGTCISHCTEFGKINELRYLLSKT